MDSNQLYDMVVIGGGIYGVGISADAAGRGLSVLLCEQNDLASGTSSTSSKLIHGGLRYLEQYNFKLVRESLKEREILIKTAPHLVQPMRFVVPFMQQYRPFWLLRLGILCYDLMGYSKYFKRSKMIHFKHDDTDSPLKKSLRRGFIYSDATVDDARLAITTAIRAAQAGCEIFTHTKCIHAERQKSHWLIKLQNKMTKQDFFIQARTIVNATGPWINEVNRNVFHYESPFRVHLVKGSHIIVPSLYQRNTAYVLQHKDGRIVFVIPYFKKFTLIGTTDLNFKGELKEIKIDFEEINYLCSIVSEYFHHPLLPSQVIHSWSGLRTLVDEKNTPPSAFSREYKLELNLSSAQDLPLLNIFGGKLTTYRHLAEKSVDMLLPYLPPCSGHWTATRPLPGGDLPDRNMKEFLEKLAQDFAWLPTALAIRYANSYGTLTYALLDDAKSIADLGQHFGHSLYEKEVIYLIQKEWARSTEDVLWRRTKLGLFLSLAEQSALQEWFMKNLNTWI